MKAIILNEKQLIPVVDQKQIQGYIQETAKLVEAIYAVPSQSTQQEIYQLRQKLIATIVDSQSQYLVDKVNEKATPNRTAPFTVEGNFVEHEDSPANSKLFTRLHEIGAKITAAGLENRGRGYDHEERLEPVGVRFSVYTNEVINSVLDYLPLQELDELQKLIKEKSGKLIISSKKKESLKRQKEAFKKQELKKKELLKEQREAFKRQESAKKKAKKTTKKGKK